MAAETVKLLIHDGKPVKDCVVTVLGLTFKENVPDLRNTRVIDIVRALREYAVNVQVHDPLVSVAEARREYGLALTPREKLKPADAVILAVAHKEFIDQGWPLITSLLQNRRGAVVDVKGRLPRAQQPAGVQLWRL